jgi:hypothetical protein
MLHGLVLRDILGGFADDDGQLDLVIHLVVLCDSRNRNGRVGVGKTGGGLEKDYGDWGVR